MSAAITKNNNASANAAMTGVMNAMGQEGDFSATRLPIKNRINALDVSHQISTLTHILINRETQRKLSSC